MKKILTVNDQSISIPWSGIEKYMLLSQYGFFGGLFLEDDIVKVIEKRITIRINDLIPTLETLEPNSIILDLGAGNSILDLTICKLFPKKNFQFILVDDGNSYPSQKTDQFYGSDYKPYNNWTFVEKSIELNQFSKENFSFKNLNDFNDTIKVNLAMSNSAWGFHFPIDLYLEKISNSLKPNGFLYVNPVLNIDQAFQKLIQKFPNTILHREFEFDYQPMKIKNRMIELLTEKTLDGDKPGFVILAQK